MIVTTFPRAVRVIEHTLISLKDGTKLAARIWLPEDAEQNPVPAILEYLPYRKRDGTYERDALTHPYLAGHGYAGVRVDLRGSGESTGLLFDEYAKQEQDDGVEVIAWLAAQPWCNGSVGMRGISWGGINTLQIAARAPAALKAIMPMCCTDTRYTDDAHYIGGALGLTDLQWGVQFKAVMALPPDPAIVGEAWRAEWRKRLEFGTGTFGDMGCHILDPVFGSMALTSPISVRSEGGAPNADNWGLDSHVIYTFPRTKYTAETLTLHWYDGHARPPAEVRARIGKRGLQDQGSIYIGSEGVLYAPYFDDPVLLPAEKFSADAFKKQDGDDHYIQFVEACRGHGLTSAPFDYSGPLTESVLLGCLATRFPKMTLEWDAANLSVTNLREANAFVRRRYRKGWEVEGL